MSYARNSLQAFPLVMVFCGNFLNCHSWGNFWQYEAIAKPSPQTVVVWGGNSQITIHWLPVADAVSYNIYWLNAASGVTAANGNKIVNAASPYIHAGLINGSPYVYVVTAVFANGESEPSPARSTSPYVPCSTCRMLVTPTTYSPGVGFNGIVGADSICAGAAVTAGLVGTYRALLVDGVLRRACTSTNCTISGTAESIDWVLHASTNYTRSDGTTAVLTTNANAVFTGSLSGTVSAAATSYWTGINESVSWSWQTSDNTCSGWTNNTASFSASYGVSTWADSRAIAISSAVAACNSAPNSLLCVQQ